ncbi:nucleotide exchange factor GrpE [Aliiroseovarius crassostreae]|uniref:nucleotide exchange factor GrpE n=1 Tax=Aliiroseovarius crassostreae TaxID=154981 RepID=UPI003C79EEE9
MTDEKKTPAADVEAAIQELMTEQAGDEPMSLDDLANEAPPSEEILALTAERDEYKDRFMRALADAENMRKRFDRDRREAEQYGGSKLARDMLPVFDNMKRAVEAAAKVDNEASKPLIEGIELTMRSLLGIFEKHGIRLVSPEVGDKFDPEVHEAMFEAPLPGTKAGDIIQVTAEGFMIHDRLLRPAQVGVSSTPA